MFGVRFYLKQKICYELGFIPFSGEIEENVSLPQAIIFFLPQISFCDEFFRFLLFFVNE